MSVCAACGGEWLAHESLHALEAAVVRDAVVLSGMIEYQPHSSVLACPVFEKAMYGFDYRGNSLEIDACGEGHGYWLDGGEEERLQALVRQRARDLHRASLAEATFGGFLDKMRSQFGGRRL